MWNLYVSKNYEMWINTLPVNHKDRILAHMAVLRDQGPQLGRPLVGKIVASKVIPNLKELRTKVGAVHYRCFFAFDDERSAWFLVGGDKSPSFRSAKAKTAWYRKHITDAERVWKEEVEDK